MKRLVSIIVLTLVALSAWAQATIRVDVHNIVEVGERFNVAFVVEGESSPSDFSWNAGDDFTVVWGPQKGSSTSIQIINGKPPALPRPLTPISFKPGKQALLPSSPLRPG